MKHWQETEAILRRLAELRAAGRRASLATVVEISGSAYRRPGARFLIEDDGTTLGSVSGGCLEEDVRRVGLGLSADDRCRLLHYETGKEDDDTVWGLGLGCDGAVDIFVQAADGDAFQRVAGAIRGLLAGQVPFAVSVVVDEDDPAAARPVVVDAATRLTGSTGEAELDAAIAGRCRAVMGSGAGAVWEHRGRRVFTEVLRPPPFLVVCGAGDDALPLVDLADRVGFRVIAVDHRPAYLEAGRLGRAWTTRTARPEDGLGDLPAGSDTYVVVKTHNLERDRAWAQAFLDAGVPYVGLLGPRDRRDDILSSVAPGQSPRVFGPVGLDLGAEGPEQVALSIVSELLAVRSGRRAGHLREREAGIHAPA